MSTEYRLAGPIRGELLGAEHLAERARTLATRQRLVPVRRRPRRARLLNRLNATRSLLDSAHARLAAASLQGTDIGPAGEWLLDNYHVVQEHVREVHESLPRDFYRELPELASGPLAGYPRIYELVITLIAHTEGRLDSDNVDPFFDAFQEKVALSIGELWAVPAMLRLGLLENIRRMALRTVQRLDEVEEADRWVARIQADNAQDSTILADTLAEFVLEPPALSSIFVSRFLHQLRQASGAFPPLVWLEEWITSAGLSPDEATARATERLALTKLMMANSIMSLRGITQRDWRKFVEHESRMERVLREDPAGFYPQMTFATRDQYRHVVERIAKRIRRSEDAVAREAVELARAGAAADPRRGHVGYYLIDRGLAGLEATLGYRPRVGEALYRWILRHPNSVFVGGILAFTAVALLALFQLAGESARSAWLAVALIALLPATDLAVNMVNQLVTVLLPPRLLPKLDFRDHGVPEEYRTAVVIPTLFESVDEVGDALANLEVQYLANREAHLHFALLSDFKDSAIETRESDAGIIAAAEAGVRDLNARYAPESQDAFYLFHRPRRWNERQGVWMGWERKRGKLQEFNQFLRGGAQEAFTTVVGDVESIRRVRYVITLDADTVLPPEAGAVLVGALAHPLNHAEYDPELARVVRGYGVLQPRVGVSLASAHRSRFAAIHSGHPGVDPYTTAVSDVYQDLYGEGSYTGKGIYDVDAFERATEGRFPENTLLSHDLIEGNYARAGLATDITVYDDYPTGYLTFTRRKHRWIRGDWQLLQWLTPWVPGLHGLERNRLSLLSRWKLLDNLRRSTVELAQLAFLLAGWTILPGSPLRWTLLGLGAIVAPWVLALLLAVVRPPSDKSWRAYYRAVGQDALTSAQQVALAITFLPHQAWVSLDAIVRTLWRLFVTKRKLLEWETASRAERVTSGTPQEMWRAMGPAVAAMSLAMLGTLVLGQLRGSPGLGPLAVALLPLALLWAVAPAIAYALSAPIAPLVRTLSEASRAVALRYARLHWEYFERFVLAETNWLAPDNFQEHPVPTVAMRTSPTNLGLQLLATVSAYDLGIIQLADMTVRLERAFLSLARLPRFRGHFYNWYDLRSLATLEPAYISTVDSGNLAGHLMALRQACLALADDPAAGQGDLARRLEVLAEQAQEYITAMDFGFLFDPSRKLFSIGYNPATHALDPSYYDLLASEARLASFVAIAKNDVPFSHWFRLGRGLISAAGETALVSWSGSMFEYLMPLLVMHSFPFTVLGQTYDGALDIQIAYGSERGVPWGISECAYNLRDRHRTYQYRGFGVPALGLKRGLARNLVVAPYASALAALIDPERALQNLQTLEGMGLLGAYGFYDAADYTRPDPGQPFALVRNYMAHHIGMTLVALSNTLQAQLWQQRFHSDPMVRATALLLDERVPRRLALLPAQTAHPDEAPPPAEPARPVVREIATPHTQQPHVALLGHTPYTVMVSNAGGGYSRFEDLAVSRWRADGTRDHTGQFCYVKDLTRRRAWAAGYQPLCAEADWYRAFLATDRVTLERSDGEIETKLEIVVVPEDAAEVRRVTLTNNGSETRELELTSYGEIVLAPPETDRVHPAFANLFVETEWHEWCTAITATRRPRSATERALWCVHVVDSGKERVGTASCETDRARFLGRGRTPRDPIVLEQDGALSGTTGAVLDPIFALRTRVRLLPGQTASVAFTTLVATSRERAFALADRYHDSHTAQRSLDLAWTSTQIELRELEISPTDAAVFQDLAGYLIYPNPALRAPTEELRADQGSQQQLWANGISGDWPIVLATIESAEGLATLQQVFLAHRYWRRRGMTIDLVVVNAQPHSYQQELNDRIIETMLATSGSGVADAPGGIFIRQLGSLVPADLRMIAVTARVRIPCDGRPLARLVAESRLPTFPDSLEREPEPPPPRRVERSTLPFLSLAERIRNRAASVIGLTRSPQHADVPQALDPAPAAAGPLRFDNGLGGLTLEDDYRIRVQGDRLPPAPWANVIANPRGGFFVTERGAGTTWAANSYFFRLTPWHNDPVSDPAGDALYLRDDESGEFWGPTPAPVKSGRPYVVKHSPGISSFEHEHAGIATELTVGLAGNEPIKVSLLRITNRQSRRRRLSLVAYVEWALGVLREHTQHQVRTAFEPELGAIFARNHFHPQFAHLVGFCAVSAPVTSHTGSRHEFLGRNGTPAEPAALRQGEGLLSGTTGPGLDPCAALACALELAPGETREVAVLLGAAPDEATARRTVAQYRDVARAKQAVAESVREWTERLSVITVHTPEPAFDAMLNRWSLYQALACRMWGRTAMYQSSGAYGFRDQLQDVMAFVYAEPDLARAHLVRAAGRQFVEGDVQHWWHPESGRGVRTRFSDDLVWLPYVVDHYVRISGDAGVLDESAPFLRMRALEPGEAEAYELPESSGESASVYEHCRRALRKACTAGAHGLPLIGTGDWNDGMNRVGLAGRGESVWLAWFLIATLRSFAQHADARGDRETARECRAQADAYLAAVETHGWDGAWYRRAYFDDGTPLGAAVNSECRIDSIAQSWSVISGAGDPARQEQAMQSVEEHLVLEDARIVKLLTPPFDAMPEDPGYIKGYVPGVRENGAQYTHAAAWVVLATALRGQGNRAFELYQMLNPLTHAATPAGAAKYKVEPYVIAADVYTTPGSLGRGGWTWYTGSASWMYRVGLEALLGFTKRGATLRIDPCVPAQWPELTIEYRYGTSLYVIVVQSPGAIRGNGSETTLDGAALENGVIPLVDDGRPHEVVVRPRVPATQGV
ncbi:MAG TPA: glucoamylase family protein [Gemmatimonadales bacterium]|jgi:cyclic beta-1,2-glucan synthetase|nr:glucoamylase family protein [Gemmatimonadales bacterium]